MFIIQGVKSLQVYTTLNIKVKVILKNKIKTFQLICFHMRNKLLGIFIWNIKSNTTQIILVFFTYYYYCKPAVFHCWLKSSFIGPSLL